MLSQKESRAEIKKRERAFLDEERKKHPELFELGTFIEDPKVLKDVGIQIPGQESFPLGYLKLWPQDFIVEEVDREGRVVSAKKESDGFAAPMEGTGTVYATLVKQNYSTIEAVKELSILIGCEEDKIQYAGIKDKDALTAQRISFRGIPIDKVRAVSSPHFFLKDISEGSGVLDRGALQANRFTIFVRTPELVDEVALGKQVETLQQNGFYNFHYLQRFSTPRLQNYIYGASIIRGEYKKAILQYLKITGGREMQYFREIREDMEIYGDDWKKIQELIEHLPLSFETENQLVDYLLTYPDDYRGALRSIKEQVTLWVYGVSSRLYNQLLSSYLLEGKEPPEKLPLFLSRNPRDFEPYQKFLRQEGLYPPPFDNLRDFPFIQLRQREVETKLKVSIESWKVVKGGVGLRFTLPKGAYATTFLSHLFQLATGLPPENIFKNNVDVCEVLDGKTNSALPYFEAVTEAKGE